MPGDYTAERLFGNTGRQQAEAVRAHNHQVADGLEAHLSEWDAEPQERPFLIHLGGNRMVRSV